MKPKTVAAAAALVGAVLLASPLAAATRPAAAAKVDPAAHQAQCMRLAQAITPDRIRAGQVDKLLSAMTSSMLEGDSRIEALEHRYPGLMDAIQERLRPIMMRLANERTPLYRADLAQFYCSRLTISEARFAADFFLSPDGIAMIDLANANIDYKRSINSLLDSGDASTAAMDADKRAAGNRAARQLDSGLQKRILAFFQSPVGRKLIAINPQKSLIDQKWFNYSTPAGEAEVKLVIVEAMLDHIAKTDPQKAAEMREDLEARGILPKPKS